MIDNDTKIGRTSDTDSWAPSKLHISVTTVANRRSLREKPFTLAHSFRGVQSIMAGEVWPSSHWWELVAESLISTPQTRKQRERASALSGFLLSSFFPQSSQPTGSCHLYSGWTSPFSYPSGNALTDTHPEMSLSLVGDSKPSQNVSEAYPSSAPMHVCTWIVCVYVFVCACVCALMEAIDDSECLPLSRSILLFLRQSVSELRAPASARPARVAGVCFHAWLFGARDPNSESCAYTASILAI